MVGLCNGGQLNECKELILAAANGHTTLQRLLLASLVTGQPGPESWAPTRLSQNDVKLVLGYYDGWIEINDDRQHYRPSAEHDTDRFAVFTYGWLPIVKMMI